MSMNNLVFGSVCECLSLNDFHSQLRCTNFFVASLKRHLLIERAEGVLEGRRSGSEDAVNFHLSSILSISRLPKTLSMKTPSQCGEHSALKLFLGRQIAFGIFFSRSAAELSTENGGCGGQFLVFSFLAYIENYFSYLIAGARGPEHVAKCGRARVQAKCHIKLHQSHSEIPANLQLKFVCQLKHEHGGSWVLGPEPPRSCSELDVASK